MSPGILVAVLSSLFATSKDLLSKKIAFSTGGTVSAFASFLYALPFYVILLTILYITGNESFTLGRLFLAFVFLRASTDCFAEWLKMSALTHGDISLIMPFLSLTPLFLLFLSPLITGDPVTGSEISGLLLILSGSLLLLPSRKESSRGSYRGILLAVLSSVCMSLNVCFDRLAVQEASAPLAGFSMTFLAAVFLLPLVLRNTLYKKQVISNYRIFFARGFFEVAFMTLKLLALQYLTAPTVMGILKISLLMTIIGGNLVFQEKDFKKRILAGALVFLGICILL